MTCNAQPADAMIDEKPRIEDVEGGPERPLRLAWTAADHQDVLDARFRGQPAYARDELPVAGQPPRGDVRDGREAAFAHDACRGDQRVIGVGAEVGNVDACAGRHPVRQT